MPVPVPAQIGIRLTDISPLMGPLTPHHGLVVARLTAWIGDAVAHTFSSWEKATSAALRSIAFDDLLWTPGNAAAGAAMRVNAETEAGDAAFRGFANEISRHFANCGQVTDEIRTRLGGFGANVAAVGGPQTFNAGGAGGVHGWMTQLPPAGDVYILDCRLGSIHLYAVEVHTLAASYLVQGYQGGYSAVWWLGQADFDIVNNVPVAGLNGIRAAWGQGAAINVGNLANALAQYLTTGNLIDWQALPFHPLQNPPRDVNPLALVCQRYQINNAAAVYAAMGGVAPTSLAGRALLTDLP
jgi:hypothetical protein